MAQSVWSAQLYAVSVYSLLSHIINIMLMPVYAYSSASLTIVGKANGSYDIGQMEDIPRICVVISMIFSTVIALIAILFKNQVPMIITDDANLIAASTSYITIGILSNIFDLPAIVYKYSLQGINDEKWTFVSSTIISCLSLCMLFLLGVSLNMKLYGIYIGLFIYYLGLSVTFFFRYSYVIDKYRRNNQYHQPCKHDTDRLQ
jgi:MATE family multidrug resistance protein